MKKEERIAHSVEPLIRWYRENERMLPWRKKPIDPYAVWISEIMLQQTRIEAVIPYYQRFMKALPTVKDLAEISDDSLMKLWEGLGYYSRAGNLKKAAILVCEKYGGQLPRSAAELQSLPGIGAYTAGAIASIAFGEPTPAVDGNVLRVLSRLCAWKADIALEKTKKEARTMLQEVYPLGEDAGCFTQGLMELGEVICIPNGTPLCECCPWHSLCLAREKGVTQELPMKSAKKERRIEKKTVLILENNGKYAVRRRESKGLLASMLEFPSVSTDCDLIKHLRERGLEPQEEIPCGNTVHIFSHVEWHMNGVWVRCTGNSEGFQWYTADEILHDLAFPTAFRYFRKLIEKRSNLK